MTQSAPQPKRLAEVTLDDISRTCNELKTLDARKVEDLQNGKPDMKLTDLAAMFGYRVKEVLLEVRAEPVDPITLGDFFATPTGLNFTNGYLFNIQDSWKVEGIRYLGGDRGRDKLVEIFGPATGSGYGNGGRIFVFESMNGPTPNPAHYEKRRKWLESFIYA